jgi:hypothetical protein
VLKSSERDDKPEIGLGVISVNTLLFAAAWIGNTPGFHLKAVGAATALATSSVFSPSIRPALPRPTEPSSLQALSGP